MVTIEQYKMSSVRKRKESKLYAIRRIFENPKKINCVQLIKTLVRQ